jgi:hypothetical protein
MPIEKPIFMTDSFKKILSRFRSATLEKRQNPRLGLPIPDAADNRSPHHPEEVQAPTTFPHATRKARIVGHDDGRLI